MLYYDRQVTLVEKYEVVARIWKWLQQCSKNDILKLPHKLEVGSNIRNMKFDCIEQQWLYGFIIGKGLERPRFKVPDRVAVCRPNHINYHLNNIADNLHKIKHWNIIHGSYDELQNVEATWFIDSPYQHGGYIYIENKIDYPELAKWSESRNGQIIVCENTKADWMDFKPMIQMKGSTHKTTEAIWSNLPTAFDHEQLDLFNSQLNVDNS